MYIFIPFVQYNIFDTSNIMVLLICYILFADCFLYYTFYIEFVMHVTIITYFRETHCVEGLYEDFRI